MSSLKLTKKNVSETESETWEFVGRLDCDNSNCMTDGCSSKAIVAWVSTSNNKEWKCCEPCQLTDFGGWPDNCSSQNEGSTETVVCKQGQETSKETVTPEPKEKVSTQKSNEETPIQESHEEVSNQEPKELSPQKPKELSYQEPSNIQDESKPYHGPKEPQGSEKNYKVTTPSVQKPLNLQTTDQVKPCESQALVAVDASPVDEAWDLKKVMTLQELKQKSPVKCKTEGCGLLAACVYVSNLDPKNPWPSCLDCQILDFGGWPDLSEMPIVAMTKAHKDFLVKKCSKAADVAMPSFPRRLSEAQELAKQESTDSHVFSKVQEFPKASLSKVAPSGDSHQTHVVESGAQTGTEIVEEAEAWDLKKVMTLQDLQQESPVKCKTDGCTLLAACEYVSNKDPENSWPSCVDCQALDFGGWPAPSEMPIKEMPQEQKDLLVKLCSRTPNVAMPDLPLEPVESWELKKVMSVKDLTEFPIKCSTESCKLLASCVYISNLAPTSKWYSCLDCQEMDYGGWPGPSEMPIREMSEDHAQTLISKCSKKKDIAMPVLPKHLPLISPTKVMDSASHTLFTPDPNQMGKKPKVTPSPAVASASTKTKAKSKPSKQFLELHRKWQAAAEKAGGPSARIVVDKNDAKKLIFDLLYDKFRPMNITQVNTELKAVVPPPVLKACLDDMALDPLENETGFADSDDEEDDSKKTKKKGAKKDSSSSTKDPFASSLCMKAGRSANATLYFVDHTKCQNNGNGLPHDERNELLSNFEKTKSEIEVLKISLQKFKAETAKLLSEPKDDEASTLVECEEVSLAELLEKVEAGRKIKVNEKRKQQVKKSIGVMAGYWRKRRRMCTEFLINMEEMSDGTISMKKCLSGDGQIELESDEVVIKAAKLAAENKKRRGSRLIGGPARKKAKPSGLPPSQDFIGVSLNSQGMVERVLLSDH